MKPYPRLRKYIASLGGIWVSKNALCSGPPEQITKWVVEVKKIDEGIYHFRGFFDMGSWLYAAWMEDTFQQYVVGIHQMHLSGMVESLLAFKWFAEAESMEWTGGTHHDVLKFHSDLEDALMEFSREQTRHSRRSGMSTPAASARQSQQQP